MRHSSMLHYIRALLSLPYCTLDVPNHSSLFCSNHALCFHIDEYLFAMWHQGLKLPVAIGKDVVLGHVVDNMRWCDGATSHRVVMLNCVGNADRVATTVEREDVLLCLARGVTVVPKGMLSLSLGACVEGVVEIPL